MRLIIYAIVLLTLSSCAENTKDDFVKTYGDLDFDRFTGKEFNYRSKNSQGHPIIKVRDEFLDAPCDNWLLISLNKQTMQVDKIDSSRLPDSCKVEIEKSSKLALSFYELGINGLFIDSIGVHVYMIYNHGTRLIRFSDMRYKTSDYDHWSQISGAWYANK